MEHMDVASDVGRSRGFVRSSSRNRSASRGPSSFRNSARSRSRSPGGGGGGGLRSFLGLGAKSNRSRGSFFGGRPSYYRRSPRGNYLKRTLRKLRRLLRDLIYYMKRNPFKVFVLVLVPLIVSGALPRLLAKFGIRLPVGLQKALGYISGNARKFSDKQTCNNSYSTKNDGWTGKADEILNGFGRVGTAMSVMKLFL